MENLIHKIIKERYTAKLKVLEACDRTATQSEIKVREKFGEDSIITANDGSEIPLLEYQKQHHQQYKMDIYNNLAYRYKLYILYIIYKFNLANRDLTELFQDEVKII